MNIIKAGYEILTPISEGGIKELQHIEKIARVCYLSENAITEDGESAKKMVKSLINSHHDAMLEHGNISVKFTVDRGISHELVRHRMASFAMESHRYCNYTKDKFGSELTFIKPCFWDENSEQFIRWKNTMKNAENSYFELIHNGALPQEARSALPHSIKVSIVITANYREWRHILNLRAAGTTGRPHPQMLEVMVPLLKELQNKLPVIFDDIEVTE